MIINTLSYNIHAGADAAKKYNIGKIIATIKNSGADICGLQEVDNRFKKWGGQENQSDILKEKLGMNIAEGPCLIDPENEANWFGNALFSRFDIKEKYIHRMYVADDPHLKYDGTHMTEPRGIVQAKVDLGETTLWVICTHLSVEMEEERLRQVEKIKQLIIETKGPLLLLGDLNDVPGSEAISRLRKFLTNPSEGKNLITYSPDKKQIDYIMGRDVKFESIKIIESDASDHFPLFAKVRIG